MLKEFRDFIMRGNVVDLAVGLVAGAAFTALVGSLVANIVNPLIAFVLGTPNFNESLTVELPKLPWADAPATLKFGALLTTIITFLGTMAGVFFLIVKPMNTAAARLQRADAAAEDEAPAKPELLAALELARFVQDSDGSWRVESRTPTA